MPIPITRQKMTIDEALDVMPVPLQERTLPRTPNFDDSISPNWDTGLRGFELGLHNAEQDTLSNMLVEKMSNAPSIFKLSDILMMMDKQFAFIMSLVDKLLSLSTRGAKDAVQSTDNKKK